jgi:hypothetical protein
MKTKTLFAASAFILAWPFTSTPLAPSAHADPPCGVPGTPSIIAKHDSPECRDCQRNAGIRVDVNASTQCAGVNASAPPVGVTPWNDCNAIPDGLQRQVCVDQHMAGQR